MRKIIASMLLAGLILAHPLSAAAAGGPADQRLASTTVTRKNLVESVTEKVRRIELGSGSATITLAGGKKLGVDFGELAGTGGGTNYVGLGMLLFGLSIAMRLISTLGRVLRPVLGGRRDRER